MMTLKTGLTAAALAAASILSIPAMAQSAGAASGANAGASVGSSGTSGAVGGAQPAVVTTTLGAGPVMTTRWVNVPANVEQRRDFQRWLRLR